MFPLNKVNFLQKLFLVVFKLPHALNPFQLRGVILLWIVPLAVTADEFSLIMRLRRGTSNLSDDEESLELFVRDRGKTVIVSGQDIACIPSTVTRKYGADCQCLDLTGIGLYDLDGLEEFTSLEILMLDSNLLTEATIFPRLEQLHTLWLNRNRIEVLPAFLAGLRSSFPRLQYLSLLMNAAVPIDYGGEAHWPGGSQAYRAYVKKEIPTLLFLDASSL
jgi:Leucine-rich repeat (LRR) protein